MNDRDRRDRVAPSRCLPDWGRAESVSRGITLKAARPQPPVADAVIEQLKSAIVDECQDDLVSFSIVEWIAIDMGLDEFSVRRDTIVEAITELVSSGKVKVGDAVDTGMLVDHQPWPELGDELLRRLRRVTREIISPKAGDGFWLARVD